MKNLEKYALLKDKIQNIVESCDEFKCLPDDKKIKILIESDKLAKLIMSQSEDK